MRAGVLTIFLMSLVVTAPAFAQQVPEPSVEETRKGFTAKTGLGFGNIKFSDDFSSDDFGTLNYALSFGGYLTPRLVLLAELFGGSHRDESFRMSSINPTLSAQFFATDALWLKAGISRTHITNYINDVEISSARGAGLLTALGYGFWSTGDFTLDAHLQLSFQGFEGSDDSVTMTALQLGLSYR